MAPLKKAGGGPCVTVSRRLEMVDEMSPSALPAAFQMQGKQSIKKEINKPPVYVLNADWFLYAYQPNTALPPSTMLNTMVDLATAQLVPPAGVGKFTLGGLVEDCAINGEIELYEGLLGDRAVAIIPIRILVPGW